MREGCWLKNKQKSSQSIEIKKKIPAAYLSYFSHCYDQVPDKSTLKTHIQVTLHGLKPLYLGIYMYIDAYARNNN